MLTRLLTGPLSGLPLAEVGGRPGEVGEAARRQGPLSMPSEGHVDPTLPTHPFPSTLPAVTAERTQTWESPS